MILKKVNFFQESKESKESKESFIFSDIYYNVLEIL